MIEEKLAALGFTLPILTPPANALFAGYKCAGSLVFISGQLPLNNGKPSHQGRLGAEVTLEDGILAAQHCALNILAQLKLALDGDWSRLAQAVRVGGFVNCVPDFHQAPAVINGASKLLLDVLGDAGKHARAAVGVAALPANAAVEVEATFELKS